MDWNICLSECARIWQGGCIIRASILNKIRIAFENDPNISTLLIAPDFAAELNNRQRSWRRIVTLAIASGIPVPALSSSLSYFDAMRQNRLPANLTQVRLYLF